MCLKIHFYSYFKDLTSCADSVVELPEGSTIADLQERLITKFPKLDAMKKSTLIAVGVDYQTTDYVLKEGDELSLFPPVQGG